MESERVFFVAQLKLDSGSSKSRAEQQMNQDLHRVENVEMFDKSSWVAYLSNHLIIAEDPTTSIIHYPCSF